MQFSLRCDEGIWEPTDHEKEVTILAIHQEIKAKFYTVPIDYNGFRSFVYSQLSKSHTRGGFVYSRCPSLQLLV